MFVEKIKLYVMNKTVIYVMATNKIVSVVDEIPDIKILDKTLDFMPLSLWNEGMKSMGKPTIRLTDEG